MEICIRVQVGDQQLEQRTIDLDDKKVFALSDDELEAAIAIIVRQWAEENIIIEWEIKEDPR